MSFKVLGVGEVLWDMLPSGPQLGGAPANFAYDARALGAASQIVTRVGRDDLGQEILRRFEKMDLPVENIQIDETAATGTARVTLTGEGVAHFAIQENVAWDLLEATAEALEAAREADAICFGSLAQRSVPSASSIRELVSATRANALRVFDINLRQTYYSRELIERSLDFSNIFKLNDEELGVISLMFNLSGSPEHRIEQLARRFKQQLVALTRGPEGSLLFANSRWANCASRPIDIVDTVGAGDAFTAALVLGLLHKLDLDEINRFANEVARHVCSKPGATPPMPAEFAERLSRSPRQ
jgi:fructokinase